MRPSANLLSITTVWSACWQLTLSVTQWLFQLLSLRLHFHPLTTLRLQFVIDLGLWHVKSKEEVVCLQPAAQEIQTGCRSQQPSLTGSSYGRTLVCIHGLSATSSLHQLWHSNSAAVASRNVWSPLNRQGVGTKFEHCSYAGGGLGRRCGELGWKQQGSLVSRILPGTHELTQVLLSLVQTAHRGSSIQAAHWLVLTDIHTASCIQGYKYIIRTQAGDTSRSAE